ncbi:hydrolase 2, exosortase A system-associated [Diaphorobacter sp.]|uniref:hydrolase 2, exosortase A system-associated n=1 Tax=Diaphorobacter sp. TaxID=1934310 RepID=UPI003D0B57C2
MNAPVPRALRPALPQAFFLPIGAGQRFCLYHPPQGSAPRGRVLYLHPFAEELNASRRVVAAQARALAQAGFGVLQIDLLGCGDSSGHFADASWADWLQDAQQALHWLSAQCRGPLWLWGLRSGALLAAQLAAHLAVPLQGGDGEPVHLLLWQPVTGGRQMLQQFLRLHAASQWLGNSHADQVQPSQALAQGQAVEIAGYVLSPRLAQGLDDARMPSPASLRAGRLVWLEVSPPPTATLSPATDRQISAWRAAGWQVQAQAVAGPSFWQTVNADEAPGLMHATLAALDCPPMP